MVGLARLEEWHALAHLRVEEDHARLRTVVVARAVEGVTHRLDVVAVQALHVPAERGPLVGERLEAHHLVGMRVGLLVVQVHQHDEVGKAVVARGQCGFPRRTFVELAVGHAVVDEGGVALLAKPERHPHGDGEPLAERSARHLHPRRVARHARHGQAAIVGAIGLELFLGEDARIDEGGVERDRVVAVRKEEAVAALPLRVVGAVAKRMAVGDGEDVGHAERLGDVALALHFTHAQRETADVAGTVGE